MEKKIIVSVSDRTVTVTVPSRSETSTVIAASETDKDILEAVKNAIDDVFTIIRINNKIKMKNGCTSMVIIGHYFR